MHLDIYPRISRYDSLVQCDLRNRESGRALHYTKVHREKFRVVLMEVLHTLAGQHESSCHHHQHG